MNKLSVFVLAIFLLLGAALWGLANVSFLEYFKSQLSSISQAAIGYETQVEALTISKISGELKNLKVIDKENTLINITHVSYLINEKSLKSETIEIEHMVLTQFSSNLLTPEKKAVMITSIDSYLNKNKSPLTNASPMPRFIIKNVSINNANHEQEIPLNSTIMNEGLPADEVFLSLFKEILTQQL